MELAYDIPSSCSRVVTNRCDLKVADHVLEKLNDKEGDEDLIYKLGLLTVLEHVVLSNECRTLVDKKWFHLVENLEEFNGYPWGNLSYEYTVKLFKRKRFDNIKNTEMKYSLHGFPLAIMVWAFEALPELGRKFAETCGGGGRLPRILSWKMTKQWRSEQLSTFFNTSEVEVRRTLQPSRDEVQTSYLKEFRIVPEDEEEEEEEENEDEDDEEEGEEEEEKNDASEFDPPQPQVFGAEKISAIVREVVKDEMRLFSERMDMKMDKFFERIKDLVFQSKDSPSTRATYDGTNVDTETAGTVDGVEDTINSPSPMPEKEKVGVHDDVGLEMRAKDKVVLVEDKFSEEAVSPKKNEHGFDTGIVTDPSSKIFQKLPMEIEEIDEDDAPESLKGRGHRKKRKAAVLLTPWRNPEKRQKIPNVTEYDPHDNASKVESFDRTNFPKALVKYAEGKVPPHAKAWTSCTKLFVAFCTENNEHWVALDIDLFKRCIDAYDSLPSVMRKRQFETELEPIRVVVPMLMRMLNATYSSEKFDLKRLPCPSQANGFDCGMFTIKFIEYLHAGKDVKGVEQKMILSWHIKLAAEIFAQHFDP
ncbi:Ulp1 protease family protein [Striga asiatica]|uniref:Ulp1 protease family protein n=1 Tax=Striga asiatica TaxID=4170 RepID=A0A5A7Q4T3_STRAF|nr:Ulp1 protease family protein [Striga asiatica]